MAPAKQSTEFQSNIQQNRSDRVRDRINIQIQRIGKRIHRGDVNAEDVSGSRRRHRPDRRDYLPPNPNFMKMSSLPLLRISPPGAVISVNFCMRLGWVVGGSWGAPGASGCTAGAGTTAGPARRAGEGAAGAWPSGVPAAPAPCPGDDAVGVLALPTLVRAIVLAGWTIAAPLPLACRHITHNLSLFQTLWKKYSILKYES